MAPKKYSFYIDKSQLAFQDSVALLDRFQRVRAP